VAVLTVVVLVVLVVAVGPLSTLPTLSMLVVVIGSGHRRPVLPLLPHPSLLAHRRVAPTAPALPDHRRFENA
jgi:hypothetical protein